MSKLYFHPSVTPSLESFRESLPHATLLSGKKGIGLTTAAIHIAGTVTVEQVVEPNLLKKTSSIPQIGVEMIRELYEATRTKHETGRVIIIKNADAMTPAAQHAFLKLLEEPNESTHFILTTHAPDRLLPTIRSRVQHVFIPVITAEQTAELVSTLPKISKEKSQQLHFIADGLPAEIHRLSSDDSYFEATAAHMRLAKLLLSSSPYDVTKLIVTTPLQRVDAMKLIESMIHMLEIRPEATSVKRLENLMEAYEIIEGGANIKLQLVRAML